MALYSAVDQEARLIYIGRCLLQYLMLNGLLLRIINTSYSSPWSDEEGKSSELVLNQMLILHWETLLITLCNLSSRKIDLTFCCGIFQNYSFSFKLLKQWDLHHFLWKRSLLKHLFICNYLSVQQEIVHCRIPKFVRPSHALSLSEPTNSGKQESIVCMEKFK